MADTPTFLVVTASGAHYQTDASHGDYFTLLEQIYSHHMTAGGNWDPPNMLLVNGKVVVESGLDKAAWNYGQALRQALQRVRVDIKEKHTPLWLKEFQPPAKGSTFIWRDIAQSREEEA